MRLLKAIGNTIRDVGVYLYRAAIWPFYLAKREVEDKSVGLGCAASTMRLVAWLGLATVTFVAAGAPAVVIAVLSYLVYLDVALFVVSFGVIAVACSFRNGVRDAMFDV